jgi:hypothetical protein
MNCTRLDGTAILDLDDAADPRLPQDISNRRLSTDSRYCRTRTTACDESSVKPAKKRSMLSIDPAEAPTPTISGILSWPSWISAAGCSSLTIASLDPPWSERIKQ